MAMSRPYVVVLNDDGTFHVQHWAVDVDTGPLVLDIERDAWILDMEQRIAQARSH